MSAQPEVEMGWAIYCRLSRAKDRRRTGRQRAAEYSVALQEQKIREWAAAEGIPISDAHVYVDNGKSAWMASSSRPEFRRMVAAGKRGEFPGILAYKLDRFTRNMREAEDLIDLAEQNNMAVWGPNSGKFDLRKANGKNAFRKAALQAAEESDNTSERVKPVLVEMAREGYPIQGGRMFGYEITSQIELPEGITAMQRPAEVVVLREMADKLIQGIPLQHLARELNERGVTTVRGGRFTGANLGRILGNRRYGGEVWLNGELLGRLGGEPVFGEDVFERVQAMFIQRRRGRRPTGGWPLSGSIHCGRCGGDRRMVGRRTHRPKADGSRPRYYTCIPQTGGCTMSVLAEPVEELVTARVLAESADVELARAAALEHAAHTEAREAVEVRITEAEDRLVDLVAERDEKKIIERAYQRSKAYWDAQLDKAIADLEALGTTPRSGGLLRVMTADELSEAGPSEWRRLLADMHLSVIVNPPITGAPRNRFNAGRVVIEPGE